MENRIHLNVFDFDETLFRVPGYTCKEAKGMTPYEWFDSPESLSPDFNIRSIINTCEMTQSQPFVRSALITHRVPECRDAVIDLLKNHGIKFDCEFFLGRETPKSEIAISLIDTYAAGSITIYEDSLWEIIKYTEAFINSDIEDGVDIKFVFVDKSRVISISWEAAWILQRTYSVEKLRVS